MFAMLNMETSFNADRFMELLDQTLHLEQRLNHVRNHSSDLIRTKAHVTESTDILFRYDPQNASIANARTTLSGLVQQAETAEREEVEPLYRGAFANLINYLRDNNPIIRVRVESQFYYHRNSIKIDLADSGNVENRPDLIDKIITLIALVKSEKAEEFLREAKLVGPLNHHFLDVIAVEYGDRGRELVWTKSDGVLIVAYRRLDYDEHSAKSRWYKEDYGDGRWTKIMVEPYPRSDKERLNNRRKISEYDCNLQGTDYEKMIKYLHELQETGLVKAKFSYESGYEPPPVTQAASRFTVGRLIRALAQVVKPK